MLTLIEIAAKFNCLTLIGNREIYCETHISAQQQETSQ